MTARDAMRMSEDELLRNVLELCSYLGITTAHFRPARTEHGWRTAVQGDGKGFPDLVLVGGRRLAFRELKSARGQLDADQRRWRDYLLDAGQDWALWRPAEWSSGAIPAELKALSKGEVHA